MEDCTPISRCLICCRSTLENLSRYPETLVSNATLLQDFLTCFHINVLDSEVNDLSTSCQFCRTCEQFITEWSSIQTQMTQLTRRAAQLKATLSALLLSALRIHEQNYNNDVTNIIKNRIQNSQEVELPLLLQQTVDDIRNELQKEYSVSVMVEKVHLPCSPSKLNHEELDPLSGHCDSDDEPMDDWRGDDDSDAEYLPSEDQMDNEETSDQNYEMKIKTEEEASSVDSDGGESVELKERRASRKSNTQTKGRRKSQQVYRRHSNLVVIPDGPNKFKYHGHGLSLNDGDKCYYCGACDFKGTTNIHTVLSHIRKNHYTEEEKQKLTGVQTSYGEWLDDEETSEQIFEMSTKSEEKARYDSNGLNSVELEETKTNLKSKIQTKVRRKRRKDVPKRNRAIVISDGPNRFTYKGLSFKRNEEDQTYTCDTCGFKSLPKMLSIKHHIGRHFIKPSTKTEQRKSFAVPDGPNTFKYNGHSLKLNNQDRCYCCGACDFKGTTKIHSVLTHIREIHYTEEDKQNFTTVKINEGEWLYGREYKITAVGEKFRCVLCGSEKSRVGDVIRHIRTQHVDMQGPDEVAAPLPVTDTPPVHDPTPIQGVYQSVPYTFNPADNMYTCGICQSQISCPRRNLGHHINKHHTDAALKVICEVCGKELINENSYKKHLRKHQTEPKNCPTCDKRFWDDRSFKRHLKIHAFGEAAKKYQCEYCGKKFIIRAQCRTHVMIHTGEKPHECHVCGKRFRYSCALSKHRQRVHKLGQRGTRNMIRIND